MSSLSQSRVDLRNNGPKIRISIGHPQSEIEAAKKAQRQLKPPHTIMAMIDTGASVTLINNEVAVTCGLRPTAPTQVSVVGSIIDVNEFVAAIRFVDYQLKGFDPLRVVGSSLPRQEGIACLLGRDILERWALYYDGRNGELWVED
jgi:hypothetical protein